MKVKVFIDGSSGTTGLRIADRLAERPEIELLSISAEGRKDVHERAKVINSADLAFLCLPDAASKEVMPLLRPDVKVLDTSTAFRTDAAWDYGFPELAGQCLHARRLTFRHPRTGERITLACPLPDYFQAVLTRCARLV